MWTNNQCGDAFVSKKLDRALSNLEWLQHFGNIAVEFLERGVLNHSPILVYVQQFISYGPKPFKFFKFWANHPQFLDWIAEGWSINVEGYSMFRLYSKLKTVKRILKVKNLEVFGGLGQRVTQARRELAAAQAAFLFSHGDAAWLQKEIECLHVLISITAAEKNFLKQKSWNNWLNLGDGNTSFFHKVVRARNSSNLIKVLLDVEGTRVTDMQRIKDIAWDYYQNLLGHTSHEFTHVKADKVANLFCKKFSPSCVECMQARVTKDEIQQVILSMNRSKASGPDGFSAGFFQQAWPIVGEDVCDAIMEFFSSGRLLKEVNSTIITLVPKKKNATSMGDFRPISCCNLVYKCITKIMANRLVAGLDEVISSNQGAFVPKRSIVENILLAQELVCNYHRTVGKARCTLKIDLMKA
jgi:hypothetical protein